MNLLNQIVRPFFWKSAGCISSLGNLDNSHGVMAACDVTKTVGAQNQDHPLLVSALKNGKIIADLRLVATANDMVIGGMQSLLGCPEPQQHYLLHRRRIRFPQYRPGTALLMGVPNGDNYYHWLLDSLPRWKMLQAAGWADFDHVLLPPRPIRFQDETLDRLGIPSAKRLRCSKIFIHQFECLVVPAMPYPVEEVPGWVCAWSRSLFPEKMAGPEKIYLRRGPGRRRLVNEPQLESALITQGFVVIQPEILTMAEQAKFLSSARWVVSPHGAALTNLIFAPPGAVMLELFHPQHKNRSFANLAASCGHHYCSVDGYPINHGNHHQLEYSVDVSAVLETLKAMP